MAFAFVVTWWLQRLPYVGDELDAATLDSMQQREVYLQEQMTKLLQEVEQSRMEQSRMDEQPLHSSALQSWIIWTLLALLLFLLFWLLLWCYRKRQQKRKLQRIHEACRNGEKEQEEMVDNEDLSTVTYRSRSYLDCYTLPLKPRQDTCGVLKELMDDLLRICRTAPRSRFMPKLQARTLDCAGFEDNSPEGSRAIFRMLVPMKPPVGLSFHLELGPERKEGLRNSRIRVELKCMCARERLVGDILCFLHHPKDELRKQQKPSLLETLCTGSYLDMDATATWFQELVREAWVLLPQSDTVELELLPSTRSCKLRLTTVTGRVLCIELVLGLQQEGSETFLTFE